MHSSQYPYLELHDAMVERRGRFSPGGLVKWHRSYPAETTWLDTFRCNFGPQSSASSEDSWRLYALSRVLEVINLSFQSGRNHNWLLCFGTTLEDADVGKLLVSSMFSRAQRLKVMELLSTEGSTRDHL